MAIIIIVDRALNGLYKNLSIQRKRNVNHRALTHIPIRTIHTSFAFYRIVGS